MSRPTHAAMPLVPFLAAIIAGAGGVWGFGSIAVAGSVPTTDLSAPRFSTNAATPVALTRDDLIAMHLAWSQAQAAGVAPALVFDAQSNDAPALAGLVGIDSFFSSMDLDELADLLGGAWSPPPGVIPPVFEPFLVLGPGLNPAGLLDGQVQGSNPTSPGVISAPVPGAALLAGAGLLATVGTRRRGFARI